MLGLVPRILPAHFRRALGMEACLEWKKVTWHSMVCGSGLRIPALYAERVIDSLNTVTGGALEWSLSSNIFTSASPARYRQSVNVKCSMQFVTGTHSSYSSSWFCSATPFGSSYGSLCIPSVVWSGLVHHSFICEGTRVITWQSLHSFPSLDKEDFVFVNYSAL